MLASVTTWTSPGLNNSIASSFQEALRRRQAQKGFTPWSPPTSPPGSFYDPALGTMQVGADGRLVGIGGQAGQAQRGLDALAGDTSDQNARAGAELGFTVQGLERQRDRSLADLLTAKSRWDVAHGQADARESQDYQTATSDLGTNYARLATSQAGAAVQAGATGGGFAAALAARQANQAHDQGAIDLQHNRYMQDSAAALDQSNQDFISARTRTEQNYGTDDLGAIGAANRQAGYGISDAIKQLATAGNENQAYQQDLNDQRWYQAAQAGFATPAKGTPGGAPSNEFTDSTGTYRIVVRGTRRYRQNPDGTETFVGTRPKVKR